MNETKKVTNWDELPLMLSVVDCSRVLGVSKPTMYEIMGRGDFPKIRVSEKRLICGKDKLREWLDGQVATA